MPSSASPPLTSLTSLAPTPSAACATGARMVSMLTTRPASASAVTTGITLRSSSSCVTRGAPGLVDSPPTSTMSAPWRASSTPCAIASSAPNHLPPSENESGVTFTTPITRHLSATGRPGRRTARPAMGGTVTSGRCRPTDALLRLAYRRRGGWLARTDRTADLAPQPADFDRRPDQERFSLKGGQPDPYRVARAGEHHESRHPVGCELGVELIQRLDLEPPRQEE